MAKKGKGRGRRSRFQVVRVNTNLALLTLADTIVLSADITAITQSAYMISADLTWAVRGLTAGEGPIEVGLASADLTDVEIAEALDASPVNESDIIARERTRRPVRHVGVFAGVLTEETLNDGKKIRSKVKMAMGEGTDLEMYARNESGANLTTGAVIEVAGKVYLNWR
ncbi:hypothetical protein [Gilliamella sp. CG33]|uniref:hypothetical protein n=1 Tax=Gilliamella sp. CG33 TaxID=3351506 RepID=UPI003987A978